MSKQRYRLTMVYGMEALDDVEARAIAKRILDDLGMPKHFHLNLGLAISPLGTPIGETGAVLVPSVKLQRVFDNKQPEAMEL